MLGRIEHQDQLFYRLRLEDYIPEDHLLRRVDRFIDLSALRTELAALYSHTGRPSIDPELDDPDVACRLPLRHPVRDPAL